jgi:predicted MFS family arabinose efflux permease
MLLAAVFEPIIWTLTAELAGESVATANGMLAFSTQLGSALGASAGGVILAVGGFGFVGLFCLGAAVLAALIIGQAGTSLSKPSLVPIGQEER